MRAGSVGEDPVGARGRSQCGCLGARSQEPGPRGGPVTGGDDGDSASRDVYGHPVVEGVNGDPEASV